MKRILFLLFLPLLSAFMNEQWSVKSPAPFLIPEQHFDILEEMGFEKLHDTITVPSFNISPQVLFSEYKRYLAVIKRDSSEAAYRNQLPDSTMGLSENYHEYMTNSKYDNYPVIGVSWDNALNYLRWRTINANKDGIYDTIYRLPMMSEWVAANRYFKTQDATKNEMNHDYSDWTMNTKDESYYGYSKFDLNAFEYVYFAPPSDSPVLKRKLAVGNSFHFSQQNLRGFMGPYYYEFHGYAHISFRYVIEVLSSQKMMNEKKYGFLKLWGLNQ